jgi:TolB-like protein
LARGLPIPMGARALALLEVLLKADGGVVTRTELMDAAWPDTSVEESNLTVQMAALRRSLSEASDGIEWIKTVPRVGYQFARSIHDDEDGMEPHPQSDPARRSVQGNLSIAVLPFRNLGDDPEQVPFSEGLSEDLITDLSKVPGMTVIARHSSFAFRERQIDLRAIGAELGVGYIVEGSVRRAGKRVRINAEVTKVAEITQVWADRFDGDLDDVFKFQDDVVGRIVAALAGALPRWRLSAGSRATSIDAYDHFVRGRALVMQSTQGNEAARPLLQAAIDDDPDFAAAHAWLAMSHCAAWAMWGEDLERHRATALKAADRAGALDTENADARMILGYIHAYEGDLSRADMEFGEALRLNPNHADAWALQSDLRVFQGRASEGVESVQRAFRLNPYPPRVYFWVLGFANYAARRYEDAIEAIEALKHEATYRTGSQRVLAASLAQLGRLDEAKVEAALFLSDNPDFKARRWADIHPFQNPGDREHFVEGYLKAGLPQ